MSRLNPMRARCHAHNRRGEQCGRLAMDGQRVCDMHGGKVPAALKKAEERMRDLVAPALSSLERQINNDEFAATKYVLDWAGFRAAEHPESTTDAGVSVTILFDRTTSAESTLSLPPADED